MNAVYCPICSQPLTWAHDHAPDQSGLDDGPYLPGRAPRKKSAPKSAAELREIRLRAWNTRRAAQAIEARSGETGTGSTVGESAVGIADAPKETGDAG